jgi:hypothetical protein
VLFWKAFSDSPWRNSRSPTVFMFVCLFWFWLIFVLFFDVVFASISLWEGFGEHFAPVMVMYLGLI